MFAIHNLCWRPSVGGCQFETRFGVRSSSNQHWLAALDRFSVRAALRSRAQQIRTRSGSRSPRSNVVRS